MTRPHVTTNSFLRLFPKHSKADVAAANYDHYKQLEKEVIYSGRYVPGVK
jgi:hypothetical protein